MSLNIIPEPTLKDSERFGRKYILETWQHHDRTGHKSYKIRIRKKNKHGDLYWCHLHWKINHQYGYNKKNGKTYEKIMEVYECLDYTEAKMVVEIARAKPNKIRLTPWFGETRAVLSDTGITRKR